MTRPPQSDAMPWLPAGALEPAHFEQAISRLLDEWSSHWFAKAKASGRVRLRDAGAAGMPGPGWRSWGGECGIGIDEGGRLALAEAMLGRPVPANGVLAHDRPLLEDVTDKCLEDLAGRISWLIDRDRSPQLSPHPLPQPSGIVWDISLRRSGTTVQLLIGRPALVRWRKSFAPKAQSPKLGGILAGLRRQPVDLGLKLGQGSLSFADLQGLSRGDVVILDSRVEAPLALAAAGRPTGIKARLVEDGDAVQLDIIEKKKVAS